MCLQSLTLASSLHQILRLGFNPRHKALNAWMGQQGLNRIKLFGQFRLCKKRMNLAVTDPMHVLGVPTTF